MEIKNAKITNVSITMSDHGCLTFWLTLEGGGWGCGYGGYCIGKGYLGAKEFTAENGDGLVAYKIRMPWREVAQSCLTLCHPMDCSLPGSSVHGIFQAGVLRWVAIPFSRESSRPRG